MLTVHKGTVSQITTKMNASTLIGIGILVLLFFDIVPLMLIAFQDGPRAIFQTLPGKVGIIIVWGILDWLLALVLNWVYCWIDALTIWEFSDECLSWLVLLLLYDLLLLMCVYVERLLVDWEIERSHHPNWGNWPSSRVGTWSKISSHILFFLSVNWIFLLFGFSAMEVFSVTVGHLLLSRLLSLLLPSLWTWQNAEMPVALSQWHCQPYIRTLLVGDKLPFWSSKEPTQDPNQNCGPRHP